MAALRRDRDDLVAWLRGHGLTVADSDANFVLFGVFADRAAVWQGLLDRGVLIRNTGPAGWLRVTVGTPAENDAFKRALWRSQLGGSADLSDASEDRNEQALREDRNL